MKWLLLRMVREDDGVLSFEWTLMFSVLAIGIVSGVAASRDAIVDEIGDAAEAMVALDQSYVVDNPLTFGVIDPSLGMNGVVGGGARSGFRDFANAFDCSRGDNAPQGQAAELDEN